MCLERKIASEREREMDGWMDGLMVYCIISGLTITILCVNDERERERERIHGREREKVRGWGWGVSFQPQGPVLTLLASCSQVCTTTD